MGESGGTAVRARHVKNLLSAVEALTPATRDRVLGAVRPAALQEVRQASALAWLDIVVLLEVDDAIAREAESLVDPVFRSAAHLDFGSAYLRPFIASAVAIFGASPGGFVKWIPRTWGTVLRNAGSVEATGVTAHEARLVHKGLALALTSSGSWLRGHRAYFDGIFDITHTTGTVTVEEWHPAAGRLVLHFAW